MQSVSHCITQLRFVLANEGLSGTEAEGRAPGAGRSYHPEKSRYRSCAEQ